MLSYSGKLHYPLALKEMREELNKASFVTVSVDASNRKDMNIVPVLIRFFVPTVGVKVKKLEFKSLSGETVASGIENITDSVRPHLVSFK